jgi:Tfp pilus assembly protein PilO
MPNVINLLFHLLIVVYVVVLNPQMSLLKRREEKRREEKRREEKRREEKRREEKAIGCTRGWKVSGGGGEKVGECFCIE